MYNITTATSTVIKMEIPLNDLGEEAMLKINGATEMKQNVNNLIHKMLCNACLCVGRTLHKITDEKLSRFYLDALREVPLCNVPIACPSLCWECKATLKKAVRFKEQVQDSYRILQTYTNENFHECLLSDIERSSRLCVRAVSPVAISPEVGDRDQALGYKDELKFEWVGKESNVDLEDDSPTNGSLDVTHHQKLPVVGAWRQDEDECPLSSRPERGNSTTIDPEKVEGSWSPNCKDDLKLDCIGKEVPICSTPDHLSSDCNPQDLESDIQFTKKKKKKKNVPTKVNKTGKVEKRRRNLVKNIKTKQSRPVANTKYVTLQLSFEDMVRERQVQASRTAYVKSAVKCESCIIGFDCKKMLDTHNAAKHSTDLGNYICPICKTIIPSVERYMAHYKRHMRRYECVICEKRTMDVTSMRQHYFSTHETSLKQYKCDICGKISYSIDTHRYHKDTHKARVQCGQCDKTFTHRAGLSNHKYSVHDLRNEFPCSVCNKVFRWKTSLKRHLEMHHTKNKSSSAAYCEQCGVTFSSVSSYQRHMKNSLKHVTQDQLRYICDHCNRRFADKTKIRDHIEEKHLHKTYQCHICHKPSKNRVALDQHIRNVHKGRPNNKMCHHCGKGFPTKGQLESHIRTHTGERPFICEFCPTTFSQQSNLYKHNRQVHLNIKSKRYPMCKKRKDESSAEPPQPLAEPYRPQAVLHYEPERGLIM